MKSYPRPFLWLAAALVAGVSLAACGLEPVTLVAPKQGEPIVVSGIDVEAFRPGVVQGAAVVAQSKGSKDAYVPEEKLIEKIPAKLAAAGIPARGKVVATLPGDPPPSADQLFGATANAVLVLTKLNSETRCGMGVCGTSTWYRVSLQDRTTHVERWASRMHLGSSDQGIDKNMSAMDVFVQHVVTELQNVIVVRS